MAIIHHPYPNRNGSGNGDTPPPLSKRAFARSKAPVTKKIALFPGVTQVFEPEPALEPDLEKTAQQQADLLGLWCGLAGELKRRCSDVLPRDLRFEAAELTRLSDELINQ